MSMKETRIAIIVRAQARSNEVILSEGGIITVRTTTVPEKGKANKTVIALLSDTLGVPKSSISILQGETSSKKTVAITGLTEEEIMQRVKSKK